MPRLPNFYFPDVNVWLALAYNRHVHHTAARAWVSDLDEDSTLCFCRLTQLGLLRLLSTESVMGEDRVMSQVEAWKAYDRLRQEDRVVFLEEPEELELEFRALTQHWLPSPKGWVDAYLAAFASLAGHWFVTFDKAFGGRVRDLIILEP